MLPRFGLCYDPPPLGLTKSFFQVDQLVVLGAGYDTRSIQTKLPAVRHAQYNHKELLNLFV